MPLRRQVDAAFERLRKIFDGKLAAYGTKDVEEYGLQGVISRIVDKKARLENLSKLNPSLAGDEPLEDTCLDLMGYGLIAYLLVRDEWSDVEAGPTEVPSPKPERCLRYVSVDGGDGIKPPAKAGDAGYDLLVAEDVTVAPRSFNVAVPSRVGVKVPDGYFLLILNRSSAAKRGLTVIPGLIDEGYTGELFSIVQNHTDEPVILKKGDRVAQCVLVPRYAPPLVRVENLPETERGATGFGSSG